MLNESNLIETSPISLNKTVMFFVEKGYTPDAYGYLHKNNKYVKLVENGFVIVNKNKLWNNNGIVLDKDAVLLHIAD